MRHSLTHTKKTWLYNKQPKHHGTGSRNYRFTSFFLFLFFWGKTINLETETPDYKMISTLSSQLIWWDCRKMGYMRLLCTCVHKRVFILPYWFRGTNSAREEHSEESRYTHYSKRADYRWFIYPSSWWGSISLMFTAMMPNISVHCYQNIF